jgi:hypothetical protein
MLRAISVAVSVIIVIRALLAPILSQPLQDIHKVELLKERGVFLRKECFCETVSRHLRHRQPFDSYHPILHLLV